MTVRFGIGGDGQLGRMMVPYTQRLGLTPVILGPSKDSPGGQVAETILGDYRDADAVVDFGAHVDILTIEFEDVDADGLEKLEKHGKIVHPSAHILRTVRDK